MYQIEIFKNKKLHYVACVIKNIETLTTNNKLVSVSYNMN